MLDPKSKLRGAVTRSGGLRIFVSWWHFLDQPKNFVYQERSFLKIKVTFLRLRCFFLIHPTFRLLTFLIFVVALFLDLSEISRSW